MNIRYIFRNDSTLNGLQDYVRSELRKCHIQSFITKKLKGNGLSIDTQTTPADMSVAFSTNKNTHTVTCNFKSLKGNSFEASSTSSDLYVAVGNAVDGIVNGVGNKKTKSKI